MLLSVLLNTTPAHAQVTYSFKQDTLEIRGGNTFANLLQVTNPYPQKVILTQNKLAGNLVRGLISLPDSLVLNSGETRNFPLKYIADRQTININFQEFSLSLISSTVGVKVQKSAHFITRLSEVKGLTIGTESDEIYLSQLSNQAQLIVRVSNDGFVPIRFRLALSGIPDGLEFTGQTMNLTLQPGTQQLLPFLARNKTVTRTPPDFTVTIDALDDQNKALASKIIRILNISSSRRVGQGNDQFLGSLPNSVSLRYASLNNDYSFIQLQANGLMSTGESSNLEYRLNVDRISQAQVNGLNIYNSYLDYNTKHWGIRAGNIYENLDFQMSGRGLKLKGNLGTVGVLSVYGIENEYMLFDQINRSLPSAKIFAADLNREKSTQEGQRITYMHKHDAFTRLDADQITTKNRFKLSDDQTFGFEAGYSSEIRYDTGRGARKGFSAGLNYFLKNEQYIVNANGYYSSPYFTGIRRGQLNSEIRLQRQFDDINSISLRGTVQINQPKYQDLLNLELNNQLSLGINKNAIYVYEIAYSAHLGSFQLGGGPFYMGQQLATSIFSSEFPSYSNWRSSSARFSANMSYGGRVHGFSVIADYGYTYVNTSDRPPAPFHSLKINGSYTMPFLGFNAYAQFNPYYLSDVVSYTPGNNFRLYSFGPNVHFSALSGNLNVQASGMYNYYGFTRSNNYSALSSLRYSLKGNWTLTGDVQYAVTKQQLPSEVLNRPNPGNLTELRRDELTYNNRQFRLGIEKQFGRKGQKGNKLELTYYEDQNNNGKRDTGEQAVPGVLVKINTDAALTNSNGEVVFKDMKKEAYAVNIINTRGWSLPEPTVVFLNSNKHLEIPLVKTQALNGSVVMRNEKYTEGRPALSGIKVTAADNNGRVHETITDGDGRFCFYLPRSKYTVYINTEGLPFAIENGKEEVILQGKPVEQLTFIYKDQHRKIGVTRF